MRYLYNMDNIHLIDTDLGISFNPVYGEIGAVTGDMVKEFENGNGECARAIKEIEYLAKDALAGSCYFVCTGLSLTKCDDIAQQLFRISFITTDPIELLSICLIRLRYEKKYLCIPGGLSILCNTINLFNELIFYNTAKLICVNDKDPDTFCIKLLICPYDKETKRAVVNDGYDLINTSTNFLNKCYNIQFWEMFSRAER